MALEKLYYSKYFCPQTLQILITAEFTNKKLQLNEYNKKYDHISLITQKGFLNKPNSILRYLAYGTNLIPTTSCLLNQLNTWFQYFNIQLYPLLTELYAQIFGEKQTNQKKYNYCYEEIHKILKIIDESLKIKSFFIGHNITILDIYVVCSLQNLFRLIITEAELKKYNNLKRWFNHIRDIPIFNKFYGKKILCGTTAFKIYFKKQQEKVQAQQKEVEVEIGQKNIKKSQEVTPVNEGLFKLDDWKREFQNSPSKIEVINKLLDNFQKQHWSIWKIHYEKDVSEGKVLFLTQNLANGTLQRLDGLRKSGFGSWGVYGEEGDYQIRGVMLWKGTQKHQVWKEHPSVEYHLFTKLDFQIEEHRNLILDYWMQKECAEGLMHQSTKIIV